MYRQSEGGHGFNLIIRNKSQIGKMGLTDARNYSLI